MGLVNQLANFTPKVASAASTLRDLLSPRNAFIWMPDQQSFFQVVKEALSFSPLPAHFDPHFPSMLQIDAFRLRGVGYALLQCGLRFLCDAETRYAVVELELVALVWASRKCRLYLLGLPHFSLVIGHRPLVPILKDYTLNAIDTLRR